MSAATVVLATNNAKKLTELRRMLADAGAGDIAVLGLSDLPASSAYPPPEETESSFEGNALIKARACLVHTGLPSLADDSGLSVDVLNQMPGVRSARWAGPEADDEANNALLLRQLDDVPESRRTARFVCAVAFVVPGGAEFVETAEMTGRILEEPRGDHGFGYDPLFQAVGQQRSNAELSAEEKDAISHRGKAVRAILPVVVERLLGGRSIREPSAGAAAHTDTETQTETQTE